MPELENSQIRILRGLLKAQEISERIRLEKQIIRENRKESFTLSARSRFLKWLFEHPDIVFTPSTAKSGLDVRGEILIGFPKIGYSYFHKSLLPSLRKDGLVTYYWDPIRKIEIKGQYQFNLNYRYGTGECKPPAEFHDIKIELPDPIRIVLDKAGRKRKKSVTQKEMKYIFENNPFITFDYEENKQKHTWTYKAQWRGREVTVNINNNNSKLTEIWVGCTNDSLAGEEFVGLFELLRSVITSNIWDNSNPVLKKLGVNRDYQDREMVHFNNYLMKNALNDFVQLYNKGNRVRAETHYNIPLDFTAIYQMVKQGDFDRNNIEVREELYRLRKETKITNGIIADIKDTLNEYNYRTEAQALEMAQINGNLRDFLDMIRKPLGQEEGHPSFIRADQLVDSTGYG